MKAGRAKALSYQFVSHECALFSYYRLTSDTTQYSAAAACGAKNSIFENHFNR